MRSSKWLVFIRSQLAGFDRSLTHTFTIESLNNRIRCHLARLKRRTHNYSKSRENLAASILFFILNKCGGELHNQYLFGNPGIRSWALEHEWILV